MLYLEDYLEMIDNLPMEMRERLTEMRETDLQVQNTLDRLDEQVEIFFKKCTQPNLKQEWKDAEFKNILEEYGKAVSNTDDKVQLANHIHDLVDRYARKLDQELSKFKMELEADSAGITEILEKKSLELDVPTLDLHPIRQEKRRATQLTSLLTNYTDKCQTVNILPNLTSDGADSLGTMANSSASNSPSMKMLASGHTSPSISYSLGHIGAGSNAAIAAAASQAIAATQQMQQGRRTSSMKASYELSKNVHSTLMNKDLTLAVSTQAAQDPVSTVSSSTLASARSQRTKKHTSKAAALLQQQAAAAQLAASQQAAAQQAAAVTQAADGDDSGDVQVDDWQPDPNEPRYCLCNQVSYGDMVGCDNEDCPIEWFHYPCVNLTQAPKGKWFCPQCTAAMKRRGRR